jgi:peptidoglycan hydrolase-like protein with peptidoglycan-binding domain
MSGQDEEDPYESIDAATAARKADPYAFIDEPGPQSARFRDDPDLTKVLGGEPLTRGSRGQGVKRLQQALIDMGFALPGSADGSYGKQTTKAVRNFQTHASKAFADVTPTGEMDAATLRALDELAPEPGEKGQAKNTPSPFFEGKRVRVVVLKDEHRTFLFDKRGELDAIFMNAVGAKASQTGEGLRVVTCKYDEEGAAEVGQRLWGGPVFGARIVDLSKPNGQTSGEELHGTVSPGELGEDVSHGCVRHADPDIITIFEALSVGERVAIVRGLDDPRLGQAS